MTGLDNDTAHTFQLRAMNAGGASGSVESSAVTPSGHGRIVESISLRRYDDQDGEPYGIGDKIVFVAKFSQDVKCYDTGTTPRVVFDLGTGRKSANRTSGNVITRNVRYEYTVAEGDADTDGIGIPAGSTALPNPYYASGSCSDTFDKSGIKAQGPFPDRKVDGVYPSLDSAVVAGTVLNLTWDETLHDDSDPVEEDFAVTVAGSARSVTGLVIFDDSAVRLFLASAVRAGETVTVSYTKGTNPLKDLASNEAPALTDHAVKNNTVRTPPAEVTGFSAREGVVSVTLRWDAPASDADITHHEYRFKTTGSYPATWTPIPDSAPGGANEAGYRVEDLTADTAHTFELRAVNDAGAGDADETEPVTPTVALPPNPDHTNFYLWRTTMTVGETNGYLGYQKREGWGELSIGREFNYPPWSPPHKHHFDPDYRFAVSGLFINSTGGTDRLALEIDDDTDGSGISVGNVTLWIRNTPFPLGTLGGASVAFGFAVPDVPDLDWEEDEEVRVVLSYKRRLPSAPQNVSVMAPRGEGGTLEVSWEEPEFGGTFPIECYLVEFRHPSGDVNKRKQSYPGSRGTGKGCGKEPPTSVKRTDLEPGVRYEVLVQALSGDGFGEWSDMKTAPRTIRGRALGARFVSPPERHDGEKRIKVRVAFSEAPENVGADGVEVEGGAVTSVRPVGGNAPGGAGTGSKSRSIGNRNAGQQDREVVWEIEIEPDSDGDVTVSLDAGRPCDEEGAICTADGRTLSEGISTTVEGPDTGPPPLTASFEDLPAEHDGESAFTFRIAFSERVGWMNGRRLRENVVAVAGGRATSASRVNRRRDLWQVTVEPASLADVTVTLAAGAACRTPAAVCTSDGRALSETISTTVRGPVAVSVADARAREGEDETIDFAVSLSRAASATVAVSYATADGSATAGEDYTRSGGMLRFAPGETAKTVSVPVLDDAVDEGEETLTLRLLNASGAVIADGVATGTIENADPLPAAWLARFGRTAAGQVLAAVGERLRGGGQTQATVAGRRLQGADAAAVAAAQAGYERAWAERLQEGRLQERPRAPALRDLVAGSSFSVTAADAGAAQAPSAEPGGRWTVWGRGAWSRFAGSADGGELQVDGDVIGATAGADYERGALLAGLALAYSTGSGTYDHASERSGTVASTLLSVHPYARLALHERLSVWGLFGYGLVGHLTLDDAAADAIETGTGLLLGAFGVDGLLLAAAQSGGLELAARADGLLLRMSSEAATGLAASEADLSRWRLLLEATYAGLPLLGGELRPALAVGGRYDAGAAETGAGLVLSGRLSYALPAWGLTLSAAGEGLLVHEEEGFREWGAGGSLHFDPGAPGRGLAVSVAPTWGVAGSGAGRLWALPDAASLAPAAAQPSPGARLAAELSYGLDAPGAAGALTPYAGVTLAADGGRVVRVGGRMGLDSGLAVSLEGTRAEPVSAAARHTLALAATLSW